MNINNGIISHLSPYSVTETIDRLEAILQAKDITVFARIDQKAEAEKVGLSLPPTQLLAIVTIDAIGCQTAIAQHHECDCDDRCHRLPNGDRSAS
ncbi:hypothetical protein [Pantanalinema sp. GBBB05]|uniref:DUF302 domain-containing protein n=1 Tax=Pantanalinema sp. GBBB05 TaxID=2604139 RepID=UPI003D814627